MNKEHVRSAYAAISDNKEERAASSSGGVFSVLARVVLAEHGVVYGVAMSKDCKRAEFIRVTTEEGLERLRKSKYVQAYMGNAFQMVKKDLENGIHVLFSGTGCQVNGLRLFLDGGVGNQQRYPNLVCVDVVCHGVPSPALWKKYVEYMEKKHHSRLQQVDFRCKDQGWNGFGIKTIDTKKVTYTAKELDPYMAMFLHDYCLRPSCYACKAKVRSYSDLTIADFWGIERFYPDMYDNMGTSLVLVRTKQGEKLLRVADVELKLKEVSYEEGVACNTAEYSSTHKPEKRDRFFTDMNRLPFQKLIFRYEPLLWAKRCKRGLKHFISKNVRYVESKSMK